MQNKTRYNENESAFITWNKIRAGQNIQSRESVGIPRVRCANNFLDSGHAASTAKYASGNTNYLIGSQLRVTC